MTAPWRDFEDEERTDWTGAAQEGDGFEPYPWQDLLLALAVAAMLGVLLLLAGGWPGS